MKTLRGFIAVTVIVLAGAFAASAQLSLTGVDGSRVNIEGQTGKVVVLAIGANWLPLSGRQAEFANAIAKKYSGKSVVVYFIATDSANPKSKNYSKPEALKSFSATNKLNVPLLLDPDGASTLKKYKVDQVPSFVILDKNGKMAGEQFGGITTDTKYDITVPISKVIDRLL